MFLIVIFIATLSIIIISLINQIHQSQLRALDDLATFLQILITDKVSLHDLRRDLRDSYRIFLIEHEFMLQLKIRGRLYNIQYLQNSKHMRDLLSLAYREIYISEKPGKNIYIFNRSMW